MIRVIINTLDPIRRHAISVSNSSVLHADLSSGLFSVTGETGGRPPVSTAFQLRAKCILREMHVGRLTDM